MFRVTGEIVKPNLRTNFRKEVRAIKPENAKEKVYMELGSKHRAKRSQVRIFDIKEIPPEEIENPLVKRLTLGEAVDVKG